MSVQQLKRVYENQFNKTCPIPDDAKYEGPSVLNADDMYSLYNMRYQSKKDEQADKEVLKQYEKLLSNLKEYKNKKVVLHVVLFGEKEGAIFFTDESVSFIVGALLPTGKR